jgi:Carboxypeptidase regulatory-like domain
MRRIHTHAVGAAAFLVWMSVGLAQTPANEPTGASGKSIAGALPRHALAQTPEQKPAPDQRVSGEVVDRDGKPVENAEVVFAGPKRQSVRTGPRGEFTFTGPAGNYEITVNAGERHKTFPGMKIEDNQLKPMSTLAIEREKPLGS